MGDLGTGLLWLTFPVILLAGLVHGTFGLGFPMVATPLIALYTDVRTAVLMTLLPTMAVNISVLLEGRHTGEVMRRYWPILPYILVGTLIGTALLLLMDPRPFLLLLAGAVLLYLNQDRLQMLDFGWVGRHQRMAYAVFGLTAGVMAGTVNVMVPVLIIFTLEMKMAIQAMIQLFNASFLAGKVTQTFIFVATPEVTLGALLHGAVWLVPAALGGLFSGRWLNRRITQQRYHWILRGVLWLMAAILVARFVHSVVV